MAYNTASMTLTHKGWFGICPVYFGNLDSDAPLVVERHFLLIPALWLSEQIYGFCMMFSDDPMWPLCVTGELDEPRQV